MPKDMKELCRSLSSCKDKNNPQSNSKSSNLSVDNDHDHEGIWKYPLRSIRIHRPIGKVMVVVIGECGTGKSTTLHNLFNDGKSREENKHQTHRVIEYSKLITCSHFKACLSFVDTPGMFDTQEARHEENLTKIQKFRTRHAAFRHNFGSSGSERIVYPNLVLITVKASDTRLDDRDSLFTQTLRAIDETNLIDPSRMNLIVVATYSAQIATNVKEFAEEKRRIRYVISKVVHSVMGILNVKIVFIENEPVNYNLKKYRNSDFYELPDGEVTPLNLCEAMCDHLKSSGDELGSLVTSRYFNENCEERKQAVTVENMNLIFEEPEEDFKKKAHGVMERMKAFDQERFCEANQYAGCGYSLQKECTLTSQIFATAPRSEMRTFTEKYSNTSFTNEKEYKIHRLAMYGMDRTGIKLIFSPDVSSFGKWEHDENSGESGTYKDKILISFVHHERLGTITFDERSPLVEELRTALDLLPSEPWYGRFSGLTSGRIEQFYSFFDKWGTHYVKEVGIGGSMRVDCCIPSSSSYEERTHLGETIERQIQLLSTGQEVDDDLENIVGDGYVRIKFKGGYPPKVVKLGELTKQMFAEWKNSLGDHPVELEDTIKLESYEVFLKDDSQKMSLKEATLNYLGCCPGIRLANRGKETITHKFANIMLRCTGSDLNW